MNHRFLLTASVLAAFACGFSPLQAAPEKKPADKKPAPAAPTEKAPDAGKPPETAKAEPGKQVPFHGKVTAIDPAGKSISLKGAQKDRLFAITDKTVIIGKDNAPAQLSAITVGEEVRGSALKSGDSWTANKIFIGAKEPGAAKKGKPAESPAAPAKPAEAPKKTP